MTKKLLITLLLCSTAFATVTGTDTDNIYTGDGGTVAFAFNFGVFSTSEVVVDLITTATGVPVTKTIITHYTVSATNNNYWTGPGGTVTMITAPASTEKLYIRRVPPLTQEFDLSAKSTFQTVSTKTFENVLDKIVTMIQYINYKSGLALKIPANESGLTVELPNAVDRAGEVIWFDASGNVTTADSSSTLIPGTLADGGLMIGNGTGEIEVVAAGTTSQILTGGGALTAPVWGTDLPTAVTIGSAYITRVGGTDVTVADGGTGASTLTDGGPLLGSGTGAITAMAVLADGEMIVGDGTTDPVAESGATLRTSIGVGTTDSPQFTGLNLGSATATTLTGSAGVLSVEGKKVAFGAYFDITDPTYGAVSGGAAAANTAAIQAAIDAAELVGGTVFIPPGTFSINSTLTATITTEFLPVNFKGTGRGSRINWDGANNIPCIKIVGTGGSAFYSLNFIEDIFINNNIASTGNVGIQLGDNAVGVNAGVINATINRCDIFGFDTGISLLFLSARTTISNCKIRGYTTYGIFQYSASNTRIVYNTIQDGGASSIGYVGSGTGVVIMGNYIGGAGAGIQLNVGGGFSIMNNYSEISTASTYFVQCLGMSDGFIQGNEMGGYVSANLIDINPSCSNIQIGSNHHSYSGGNIASLVRIQAGATGISIIGEQTTTQVAATDISGTPTLYARSASIEMGAINGGHAANDDITIQGTAHATKTTSYVNLQPTTGNVGINQTAPKGTLHLGDVTVLNQDTNSANLSVNAGGGLYLKTGFGTNIWQNCSDGQIAFQTAPSGSIGNAITLVTRGYFTNAGLLDLDYGLKVDGNVQLQSTAHTNPSTAYKHLFVGASDIMHRDGYGELFLIGGAYLNTTNTDWIYTSESGAAIISMAAEGAGIISFRTAPAGVAGNVATLTERLRLSGPGGLSLGVDVVTTDPGEGSMLIDNNLTVRGITKKGSDTDNQSIGATGIRTFNGAAYDANIQLGHASDTSVERTGAGYIAVESKGLTYTASVDLTSANILDLADTPITLVAAQGADTVIEFVSAVLIHDAGTAYAEPSAPDDLVIQYATSGTDVSAEIDSTGFLDQITDEVRLILPAWTATTDLVPDKNHALQLFNTGADLTTGNGTMTVKITYRVHTLGL